MSGASTLVQVVGAAALVWAIASAVNATPIRSHQLIEGHPTGREATRVGFLPEQVTPTPCPHWITGAVEWEPVPWCMSVWFDETEDEWIASGETYLIESRQDGSDGTPTITFVGTVPPAAATWHATVQGLEIRRR